jgi:hypothetical protein
MKIGALLTVNLASFSLPDGGGEIEIEFHNNKSRITADQSQFHDFQPEYRHEFHSQVNNSHQRVDDNELSINFVSLISIQ